MGLVVMNATTAVASTTAAREIYIETTIATYIRLYAALPIVILGTIGNGLSLIVLCRKQLRHLPVSVFLIILSIVDTLVLYLELFHGWYLGLTGVFLRDSSLAACQTLRFLLVGTQWSSAWIIVAVTFQRMVAVCWPLKSHEICTVKSSVIGVTGIVTISMGFSSHFFWTYGREYRNGTVVDECAKVNEDFVIGIWPWIDLVVYSIAPFLFVCIFNSIIIHKVRTRKTFLQQAESQHFRQQRQANSITSMVLTLSCAFLILTLPVRVYFCGRNYWNVNNEPHLKEKLRLFYTIASIFQGLNHAGNFLFYCVSGKSFRQQLVNLFRPSSGLQHRERGSRRNSHLTVVDFNDLIWKRLSDMSLRSLSSLCQSSHIMDIVTDCARDGEPVLRSYNANSQTNMNGVATISGTSTL